MEEKITEVHNRVARRQKELNQREDILSKRIDEINNSTYEERRLLKNIITAVPYVGLTLGGIALSTIGTIPAAVVPLIAVCGGKIIGDTAEYLIYNKVANKDYQETSNSSKEKRRAYLEIEKENAKCEAYINEYEYNHTLQVDNSKTNGNKINLDKLTKSKEKYQTKLKDINTKLVLAKNYRIYESKIAAFIKHLGKTLLWTSELVLAYAIVKTFACGSVIGPDLLVPFLIGGAMYGGYNMSIMKARIDIFNKYNKLSQTDVSIDDIESLRKYQKEYVDKIGNIKVVEEYKKCINEIEEKKLNTDPIEKDYTNIKTNYVDPTPVNYSLTLDANGGAFATAVEPLVSPDTTEMSYEFEIPNVTPTVPATPAGLNFYGWSLTGDSLSDVYVAGDTIEVTEIETTLKAVYGFRKYTITYDKNTTETVQNFVPTQFCIITDNEADTCNVIITKRVPTVSGFTLLGWRETDVYVPGENDNIDQARSKVELKPGDLTTLDSDITLHAIWWAVSTNDFQVELRWGEEPHDLDSHLAIVDNASGRVVKEVYFSNKNVEIESGNINLIANLDIDDLSSYGPETITLNLLPVSAYSNYSFYYFIKNYSGENRGLLKDSGANVTLIRKGGDTTVYEVSDVYGDSNVIWNVFAIKNGQIVERNTFTASPETSY